MIQSVPTFTPAFWGTAPDALCHRSANSGPARTALALERADPHGSVVFVSTACSGAQIPNLVDAPQTVKDIAGNDVKLAYPQIQQVRNVLCPPSGGFGPATCSASQMPRIDALLLSIGGNDVGFANIVTACTLLPIPPVENCSDDDVIFLPAVQAAFTALPGKLDTLKQKLGQLNTASVFITEYPDSVHVDATTICDEIVLKNAIAHATHGASTLIGKFDGIIGHEDLVWAADFIGKTNAEIRRKAQQFGWSFVGGIGDKFATHGYCVDSTHFTIRYDESMRVQADQNGTLHPNHMGHVAYAEQIVGSLAAKGMGSGAAAFIPKGRVATPFAL
jgi:hypothetical protein